MAIYLVHHLERKWKKFLSSPGFESGSPLPQSKSDNLDRSAICTVLGNRKINTKITLLTWPIPKYYVSMSQSITCPQCVPNHSEGTTPGNTNYKNIICPQCVPKHYLPTVCSKILPVHIAGTTLGNKPSLPFQWGDSWDKAKVLFHPCSLPKKKNKSSHCLNMFQYCFNRHQQIILHLEFTQYGCRGMHYR